MPLRHCLFRHAAIRQGGGDNNPPPGPGIVTPAEVTVTLDANGGKFGGDKSTLAVTANADGKVVTTETPSRGGYKFKGYNTKADGSGNAVTLGASGTAFVESSTVYAVWEKEETPGPAELTVTLDANGGKFEGDKDTLVVTLGADGKITLTQAPVREGYTFKGYNKKADGTGDTVAFGTETVFTESVTCYAVWEKKKITVLIVGNGGVFEGDKPMTTLVSEDEVKLTNVPVPTRVGYIFNGYNTKPDGSGETVKIGSDGAVYTANVTIYAQWEIISVTVNANGGKFGEQTESSATVGEDGTASVAAAPTRDGYILDGYNTKADGSGSTVVLGTGGTVFGENTVVYARWRIVKEYFVGGYRMQFSEPTLVKDAVKSKADDMYLKVERSGDGFVVSMIGFGDFTDSEYVKLIFHTSSVNGGGWGLQPSDLSVLVSKNKATAVTGISTFWTTDGGYTKFGHASETSLANAPGYARHDGYFTLTVKVLDREIPEFDGRGRVSLFAMEFDGDGSDNGQIYDAKDFAKGMLIDGNGAGDPAAQSSYFVIYELVSITLDGNGGKYAGDKSTLGVDADINGKIVTSEVPTRTGYTFKGYNTKADGSGEAVTLGADGTAFTASGTVYAQWEKDDASVIEITLNGNGGKYTGGEGMISVEANGDGKIVTANVPTRVGYTLTGYNTKADGTGEVVTLGADGTVFTTSGTVYAQWHLEKDALIQGYRMHFSDPALVKDANKAKADDMYLKANRLESDDGFEISMVGFGDFENDEYVKLVFHTSSTNGTGWAIQASDLSVLVGKTEAKFRTNIVKFWDYVNFGGDAALLSKPEYEDHGEYFTLKIKVMDSEIPAFDKLGKVTLFSMEFCNGAIYDGKECTDGMHIDGKSPGDPAAQSSYLEIYKFEASTDLTDGYDIKFATEEVGIYAKVERNAASMTLKLRGFDELGADDFIRLVLHCGDVQDRNGWQLDAADVSFTIYKNIVYTQTGNVSFFDNEAQAFHNGEKSLHYTPDFIQHDGYWDLTVTVEYIEVGTEVYFDTELRALLVKYNGSTLVLGTEQNGTATGDPAQQKNWFVI